MSPAPFLWLFGPSGVGKTTVGWEIFHLLSTAGVHSAYVDADQLGLCYPAPDDDRDNHRLKAANLAAAWQGYKASGATCLILSGYVLTAAEVALYTAAIPDTAPTLCRLRASHPTLRQRFIQRGWMLDHVDATLAEADDLDRTTLPATVLETDGLQPRDLARLICAPTGLWPTLPARTAPHV